MAQIFTICRLGNEWGFRDVTGADYSRSPDLTVVVETAERLARRTGGQVQFTDEAEQYYRLITGARSDERPQKPPPTKGTLAGFWARFRRRRK